MTNHFLPNGDKEIWWWKERTEAAANIINSLPYKELHDLGCGLCKIRDRTRGKKYYGYDGRLWDPEIILCDLNERFPEIRGDPNDRMGVCLGLLEYLEDVSWFVKRLSENFPCVVVSYSKRDDKASELIKGLKFLWIEELEEIFRKHFGKVELAEKVGVHWLYIARRK